MRKPWFAAFALVFALAAAAQERDARRAAAHDAGADHFVAGCPVQVADPVAGDAFAAGCTVDIEAPVDGDALAAGGTVRIDAPIGRSLYAAGGNVTIDAPIGRSARVAGGRVEIGPNARVGANVTVGGGNVRIAGNIDGYVHAAGGHVQIDGTVAGDIIATAGTVALGPNARVVGKVAYASGEQLVRDPAAQVGGGVEQFKVDVGGTTSGTARGIGFGGWLWSIGLMLIAVVLVAAAPAFQQCVSAALRTRAGMSLLIGFIALICIPVAVLLTAVTIIGLPLALLALALYLALLPVAYVSTGIGIGDWALARWAPERVPQRAWRVGAAVLGVLALSLLTRVPYAGTLTVLAALLLSLGALLLQVRRSRPTMA